MRKRFKPKRPLPFAMHCISFMEELNMVAPDGEVQSLIDQTQSLQNIAHYYSEYDDDDFYMMDTQDRDTLMNVIANKFTKQDWPMLMHGQSGWEKFAKQMKPAMENAGWTWDDRR